MDCSRGHLQPTDVDVSPKKPKQRRRSRHVMDLDYDGKCSVCQGKAGPHIYYGARVGQALPWFLLLSSSPHTRPVCPAGPSSRGPWSNINNTFVSESSSARLLSVAGRLASTAGSRWDTESQSQKLLITPLQACLRGGMRTSYVLNERPRTPIINHELLTPQEARNIQHLAGVSRIFDKSKIGVLSSWKKFLQEIIRLVGFEENNLTIIGH